jgi:hypothetical protein
MFRCMHAQRDIASEKDMARKLREKLMSGVGSLAADKSAPIQLAAMAQRLRITIHDRLEAGNLTIDEVCALANRSKTGFYADLKDGLVSIRKVGRKSVVPGPIAKRYIAGEPIGA